MSTNIIKDSCSNVAILCRVIVGKSRALIITLICPDICLVLHYCRVITHLFNVSLLLISAQYDGYNLREKCVKFISLMVLSDKYAKCRSELRLVN